MTTARPCGEALLGIIFYRDARSISTSYGYGTVKLATPASKTYVRTLDVGVEQQNSPRKAARSGNLPMGSVMTPAGSNTGNFHPRTRQGEKGRQMNACGARRDDACWSLRVPLKLNEQPMSSVPNGKKQANGEFKGCYEASTFQSQIPSSDHYLSHINNVNKSVSTARPTDVSGVAERKMSPSNPIVSGLENGRGPVNNKIYGPLIEIENSLSSAPAVRIPGTDEKVIHSFPTLVAKKPSVWIPNVKLDKQCAGFDEKVPKLSINCPTRQGDVLLTSRQGHLSATSDAYPLLRTTDNYNPALA